MNILAYLAALAGLNSGCTARHVQPRRPTGKALRNPSHHAQAARIEAAAVKRERKADKASDNCIVSWDRNPTIDDTDPRFFPFYVAQ